MYKRQVEYSAEHGTCEQCRIWHTVLARTAVWYGTGLRDGVRHDTVAAAASRAKTNSRCYKVVGSFYSSESSSTLTCCAAAVRCHKVHKRRHEHESTSTRWPISASRQQNAMCEICRTFFQLCGFACAWTSLRARNVSPWFLANFRHFEPHEHVPRTSARAPWCTGGVPECPGAGSTRKDPRPEEKKIPLCKKKHIYT